MGSGTACVGRQSAGASWVRGRLAIRLFQPPNSHYFVAARIDDLDGNAPVLASIEWKRHGPLESGKRLGICAAAQSLRDLLPRVLIGEKGLRDTEATTVEIAVEKPRRHLVGAR